MSYDLVKVAHHHITDAILHALIRVEPPVVIFVLFEHGVGDIGAADDVFLGLLQLPLVIIDGIEHLLRIAAQRSRSLMDHDPRVRQHEALVACDEDVCGG